MDILVNLGFTVRSIILALTSKLGWAPPLLARVAVGMVFFSSGWGKLHNIEKVVGFFRSLGIPSPETMAPFVGGTELVCGALLVLGLFTRAACVPLAITMAVAIRSAKMEEVHGLISLFGLQEFLFIVVLFWLFVSGPGPLSLDKFMVGKRK